LVPVVQSGGTLQTTVSALKVFSLGNVVAEVSSLDARVAAVSTLATQNATAIASVQTDLTVLTTRVANVSASVSVLNTQMTQVQASISAINSWISCGSLRLPRQMRRTPLRGAQKTHRGRTCHPR
jgi:septal ring factor EnvC (AmiA/AmiB activator)